MPIQEIRTLAQHAALRLEGALIQEKVWDAEIARIQHVVAWSQAMQNIAIAALESAAFGFIGSAIGKALGARLFMARAPLIAANAIVAGTRARRAAAASGVIVSSLEAATKTGQYIGAVSGALLQVGAKTAYADQQLPDVLLTIGMSLIPAHVLSELSHVQVVRGSRQVVMSNARAWLRVVGADVTLVDLADVGKTLLDQHMTKPSRPADEKLLTAPEIQEVLKLAVREAAITVAQGVSETAASIVEDVGKRAERKAKDVDYMDITGRFVAFYSEREKDLEYASVNFARHSAQTMLWDTVLRAFVRLEQAVTNVERGLVSSYRGPYMHGGIVHDFQTRAN